MMVHPPDFAATVDCSLRDGLSALGSAARELRAHTVSVLLLEGRSGRVAYHWSEAAPYGSQVRDRGELPAHLEDSASADRAVGRFLNDAVTPHSDSFLLVRWPERSVKVIVAFGFASGQRAPASVPEELTPMLRVSALAAWSVAEVQRLRGELAVVNERLGRRKTVERAKGALQAKYGWSEQEAYEHLRKVSRQRRKTLADIAEELLRACDAL